jgi:hypothetical protein
MIGERVVVLEEFEFNGQGSRFSLSTRSLDGQHEFQKKKD